MWGEACISIAVGGEVPGPPAGCVHALRAPGLGSRAANGCMRFLFCVLFSCLSCETFYGAPLAHTSLR
eukprot:1364649-Prymnesium_polylepis.1